MNSLVLKLRKACTFLLHNSLTLVLLTACSILLIQSYYEYNAYVSVSEKISYRPIGTESSIPPIIHQSWKNKSKIPKHVVAWMRSWKVYNKAWTYLFWDDKDNIAFIKYRFPRYHDMAKKLSKIGLADFTRYAIMFDIGGIYADLDFECLHSFDEVIANRQLIVSSEPKAHTVLLEGQKDEHASALCNAILGSRPGHPFWLRLMESIYQRYLESVPGDLQDPVTLTGPRVLQKTYAKFFRNDSSITVLPEEYFYPDIAVWNIDNMKKACSVRTDELAKKTCEDLEKFPTGHRTENTVAVHHWQCSWCGHNKDDKYVSLEQVFG